MSPTDDAVARHNAKLRADLGRKLVVYLAHPVGAPTVDGIERNLSRARRWYWALRTVTDWSIACGWMCEVIACLEAGAAEADERDRGIANMCAQVERCDAIVLVGGRVSSGMQIECDHAAAHGLTVFDLTDLGDEPPGLDALRALGLLAAELVLEEGG